MIQFSAFCLCMAKIRARLRARQLKMCLGKTLCLGHLRRWMGVSAGERGSLWECSSTMATWGPKSGELYRGRTATSSTEAEPCRYYDIIYTVLSCFWRTPQKEIPVPQCSHICVKILKGLMVQQMQPNLRHSWEKYQSQIHGTFFLHLPCTSSIFLCPALFIRIFFECKYYSVVIIAQLVNLDKSLPQCQLMNVLAPLLPRLH